VFTQTLSPGNDLVRGNVTLKTQFLLTQNSLEYRAAPVIMDKNNCSEILKHSEKKLFYCQIAHYKFNIL
jgi:hypothetical protein